MNSLKRQALVPHSCRQMYELVNNIEDYPRFLPWCSDSKVIQRTEEEVVAELEINWKGVHKRFTTRNVLKPFARMDIILVNGPLKHMEGIWQFHSLAEKACKVTLDMEFEFAGGFVDRLFQPVFQTIANSMVDAFCKRAAELYGSP
jgi:ribosome-associated toxin RatA of RatAB toxin-antitoxin module